jgi:ketosteroid isomerase-like protein
VSSQENIEAAELALTAFNRGDVPTAFASLDPDIEWVVAREHPDSRTLHGREAVAGYFREWRESVADLRVDIEQVAEAGDSVVMVGRVRGVGMGSGADVEVPIAFVSVLRDGKAIRVEEFLDPSEALRSLGLEG